MPFLRKYATLLVTGTSAIRIPIIKRGVVDFAVSGDWTPAAGDVKILIDGTAAANVANLPTAIAAGSNTGTVWEFVLTLAELTGKQMQVVISDAATKAIEDQCFIVETYGNASAMYATDFSAALATSAQAVSLQADTDDIQARLPAALTANGNMKSSLLELIATALTEGAGGRLKTAWTAFFDVATPVLTTASVNQSGDGFARTGAPVGASISADIAATKALLPAALVGGRMDSSVGAIASGVDLTATMKTSVTTAATAATPAVTVSDKTGFSLSSAGIQAIWDALTSALTTVGSIGKWIVTNLDVLISSRTKPADTQAAVTLVTTTTNLTNAPPDEAGVTTLLARLTSTRAGYLDNLSAGAVALQSSLSALITTVGANGAGLTAADDATLAAIAALNNISPAGIRTAIGLASANLDTQLATIAGYIDTEIATIISNIGSLNNVSTAQISTAITNALTAYAAAQPTEGYAAKGVVPTRDQIHFMILALLSEFAFTGTDQSIKGIDGATEKMKYAIDDATNATRHTRTS